jgi:hypothetical protein
MTITRYGRYWAVYDAHGTLVCICLYKKGALEVVRRLTSREPAHIRTRPQGEASYTSPCGAPESLVDHSPFSMAGSHVER